MKRIGSILLVALCAAVAVTALVITPAFARYSNVASVVTQYGHLGTSPLGQTLSPQSTVYDFGIWNREANEDTFTHTVRVVDASITGTLRFSWDTATTLAKDVAVHVDPAYYTAMQNSGYTDYTVTAVDGDVVVPFSLILSSPTADRVATLEVSWYPEGADEPTLFAYYLLALDAAESEGTTPSFVAEDTAFLTDRLMQVTVATPSDSDGVWLAPADGGFAAGTRYCSGSYPRGVTLLRESALYVGRGGDTAVLLLDLSAHLTDNEPLALSVGVSDTVFTTLFRTPLADAKPLTVSLSDAAGVLSAARPLTVSLTETATFRDSDWAKTGNTPADLRWQILRREGDTLHPVDAGEEITVTVAQTKSGGTLTIAAPNGDAPAGTYLLMITQYYQGYPVLETPIWFFIDYR